MEYSIHEAKTHLSRLIRSALSGEEVVVTKGKIPVVKISPIQPVIRKRRLGGLSHLSMKMSDDFDKALDDFKEYM